MCYITFTYSQVILHLECHVTQVDLEDEDGEQVDNVDLLPSILFYSR